MADTVVGSVNVEAKLQLTPFEAALAQMHRETQAFDKAATTTMKNVETASGHMSGAVSADLKKVEAASKDTRTAAQQLLDTWKQTGRATAEQIAAVGGLDAANKLLADDIRKTRQAEQDLAAATAKTTQELKKAEAATEGHAEALQDVNKQAGGARAGVAGLAGSVGRIAGDFARGGGSMSSFTMEAGNASTAIRGIAASAPGATGALVGLGGVTLAIVAALALTAKAAYDYDVAIKAVELTLYGLGKQTGASADDLMRLSERAAEAGEITVASAREQEAAFIRMGITNTGVLEELISVSKDYAMVTGQDSKTAVKELGAAFADPIAGVATLNDKLNLLGDAETQHIVRLARQGDLTGAQAALLKALSTEVDGARDHVNGLAGAWEKAARAVSNYWDAFARGANDLVTPDTLEQRQRKLSRFSGFPGFDQIPHPELDAVNTQLAAQRAEQQRKARAAEDRELSRQAGEAARQLNPTDTQRAAINDRMALVQKALARGLMDQTTATRALAAARRELAQLDKKDAGPKDSKAENLRKEAAAMDAAAKGSLDLADAYLTSSAAAIKAEAERQALTRAARSGADAEQAIRRQLAVNLGEIAAAGAKNAAGLQTQADAQNRLNDQVAAGVFTTKEASEAAKDDAALSQLIIARDLATGRAKETLTRIIEALAKAQREFNAETARSQALAAIERQNDANEILTKELELLGATNRERAVALAQARALQQLRQMNVDPTSQEGKDFVAGQVRGANLSSDLDSASFVKQATDAVKDQSAAWAIDAAVIGMTRQQASAYRKEQELLNDAARRGIDLTDAQRDSIHELAGAYSVAEEAAHRLEEQQKAAADAADFFSQTAADALDSIIDGSKSAEDALKGVLLAISKAVIQSTLLGQGPLAGIMGTQSQTGGNGGFLGSLFKSFMKVAPSVLSGSGSTPTFGGGATGNSGGSLSFANAMIAHRGATVGSATTHRQVPVNAFLNAPRLHDGLGPDEFPAILERGETVTPRRGVGGKRNGAPLIGQVIIQARDMESFRNSGPQVAGQLGQAMIRATRRQN